MTLMMALMMGLGLGLMLGLGRREERGAVTAV